MVIKSVQATVAKSFFDNLDKLSSRVGEIVKDKATQIVSEAVDLSPVDTGAFVESWQINPRGERAARSRTSAGRPRLSEGAKQAKREEEKARLVSRVESFDPKELTGFTLINRAPHIEYIEGNPLLKTGTKPSEIGAILRNKYT
jgi:hypothetical protein